MTDQQSPDERRAHDRTDIELPVRVTSGGDVIDARTVNVSEGGLLIAGDDFPSAQQVRVEIELAELGWHQLDADVVRRGTGPDGRESTGGALRRGGGGRRPRRDPGVLRDAPALTGVPRYGGGRRSGGQIDV